MTQGRDNEGYTGNGVNPPGMIYSPFSNSEKKPPLYNDQDNNNMINSEQKKKQEEEQRKKNKEGDWSIADIQLDEGEPFSGKSHL